MDMDFANSVKIIAVLLYFLFAPGSAKPSYNRSNIPDGVDLDENYHIEVTHRKNVINTTRTAKGHHENITVTVRAFSDSFSMDLKLNKFLFTADYIEKSFDENGAVYHKVNQVEDNCFYLGTVRNAASSSAAISTCEGIVGYFSIGNISYHIESQSDRLHGPHKMYRSRDDAKSNYKCGHDQVSLDSLLNPSKHAKRLRRSSFVWPQDLVKQNKIVELYVANDYSQFVNQGSNVSAVIQRTKNIVNIANAGYQPLGIYLMLVGIEVWNTGDKISVTPTDPSATLSAWTDYREVNINPLTYNDNGVLITNHTFSNGIIGLAFVGTMCGNSGSTAFVCDVFPLASVAGTVMDHEMGHNFGLKHDDQINPCNCSDASGLCIMQATNPAAPSLTWSQCSLDQFATSFQHGADICLYNVPKTIYPDIGYCGNGIVESGEQCDCGNSTSQQCNRACCDAKTCQLIAPATCAFGKCCNISTCQVLPRGTSCRAKADVGCDLDEFCDGTAGTCANDTYVPDGTSCSVNGAAAYCYGGRCRNRESQCALLWGPGTLVSSDDCYNLNTEGQSHGNCGVNWLPNTSYIPCNASDVKCGLLQCQNLTRPLDTYTSFYKIATTSFTNGDTCHTVIFDYGLATQDPGLVPNGAACGTGQMCVNQKCANVSSVLTTSCTGCQANQACNNLGQCQDTTPNSGQTTTDGTLTTTAPPIPTTTALNCATQNLTHTVVYEGSPAAFQRLNNDQSVKWEVMPSDQVFNPLKTITNYDDKVASPFGSVYAVNSSHLTIFKSTAAPQGSYATAGLYFLTYRNPNCSTAANLIVIESGPLCSCDASNPSSFQMYCNVSFAQSKKQPNRPTFTWKNSNGGKVKQETPNPTQISSYVQKSQSQLSIASSDTGTYECQLTFSAADSSPFNSVAPNAPNFTASCFISNCNV